MIAHGSNGPPTGPVHHRVIARSVEFRFTPRHRVTEGAELTRRKTQTGKNASLASAKPLRPPRLCGGSGFHPIALLFATPASTAPAVPGRRRSEYPDADLNQPSHRPAFRLACSCPEQRRSALADRACGVPGTHVIVRRQVGESGMGARASHRRRRRNPPGNAQAKGPFVH